MDKQSKVERLEKYAKRTYAGLVVRAFLYSVIFTFILYSIRVSYTSMHPINILASSFIGSFLITFGILIIQKKLAIDKIASLNKDPTKEG